MQYSLFFLLVLAILVVGLSIYPLLVAPRAPRQETSIVINKAINRLYLYERGRLVGSYPVATGKEVSATPEGNFSIVSKEANDQGLGKDNVFGTRWLGLKTPDAPDGLKYGIHGTNEPDSIGEHASAGCVRMAKTDVEEIYDRIPLGTVVRIKRGWALHRYLVAWFSRLSIVMTPLVLGNGSVKSSMENQALKINLSSSGQVGACLDC